MKHKQGFTLIELMIVIAIIAILAAILVPNMAKARAQAQYMGCIQNIKSAATALEMYRMEQGAYPPGGNNNPTQLVPDYIKSWPKCPADGHALMYVRYDGHPELGDKEGYYVGCWASPCPHASVGVAVYAPSYTNWWGWYLGK